jgi:hypothetical protein
MGVIVIDGSIFCCKEKKKVDELIDLLSQTGRKIWIIPSKLLDPKYLPIKNKIDKLIAKNPMHLCYTSLSYICKNSQQIEITYKTCNDLQALIYLLGFDWI